MASAILTLTTPSRYGVIDIRVWQLLFDLGSVRSKPRGVGFSFDNWLHYLMKLRYHARLLGVPVRAVEYSLFHYHQRTQRGPLYKNNRPRHRAATAPQQRRSTRAKRGTGGRRAAGT